MGLDAIWQETTGGSGGAQKWNCVGTCPRPRGPPSRHEDNSCKTQTEALSGQAPPLRVVLNVQHTLYSLKQLQETASPRNHFT